MFVTQHVLSSRSSRAQETGRQVSKQADRQIVEMREEAGVKVQLRLILSNRARLKCKLCNSKTISYLDSKRCKWYQQRKQ